MLRPSLAESDGHFWQPAEFENVAEPDFRNLKHPLLSAIIGFHNMSTNCYF